jgi:hypothetical protein
VVTSQAIQLIFNEICNAGLMVSRDWRFYPSTIKELVQLRILLFKTIK